MYRIELTPGEVTVFRTIEELATGVRNGLITSKARIYHSASDKWLPIEFHPHYKQALDLNAAHGGDTGGQKQAPKTSKPSSPKQGSSKDGFTFLNVPISPVTPLPKSKPRVADLPYIDDDAPVPQPPAARPSTARPSAESRSIEHPPEAPLVSPPAHDAPIERSPAYDLSPRPLLEQPPAHQAAAHQAAAQQPPAQATALHRPAVDLSPAHDIPAYDPPERDGPELGGAENDAPARHSRAEHAPAYEAPPANRQPFKPILSDETPSYRSPAQRSETHEAAVHAAFEASLPPEPVRIEEPIHNAPRSRLALEELFAPPAPRAPALPPVSPSPVLELPQISYPEITPADPPVAERASGSRARRTLHLAGAVALLAAGGYASTTLFSFGRADGGFNAASTIGDRPVVPVRTAAPSPEVAPAPARNEAQVHPTGSPPPRAEVPPASSGFAPALESRAIVTVPLKPAPKPDAVVDSTGIAPAIDMQITVPDLQGAESLAAPPRQKGDSAMKRILRAVSGKKDAQ